MKSGEPTAPDDREIKTGQGPPLYCKDQENYFEKYMNPRFAKMLLPVLITLTLFSYWAGFALLVVNKLFYKDLPGYTIGRICIWEFVAIGIAALITKRLIDKWGNVGFAEIDGKNVMTLNPKYGTYFSIFFLIATAVGIWQFWLFSQNF